MTLMNIDVAETDGDAWAAGLARLVGARADATVTVEGLHGSVTGALAWVSRDRFLVVDQRGDDATVGTVVFVPLDRIVSVQAAYRRRDGAAERRATVEADQAFLDRIRELAGPLTNRVRQVGTTHISGPSSTDLRPQLRGGPFEHYDNEHVDVAIEVLMERGDLPPRRTV